MTDDSITWENGSPVIRSAPPEPARNTDDDGTTALAILRRFITDRYAYVDAHSAGTEIVLDGDAYLTSDAEVDLIRRLITEREGTP